MNDKQHHSVIYKYSIMLNAKLMLYNTDILLTHYTQLC